MDADKLKESMLRAWCQYRNMEYVPDFVNPLPSENFERGFEQGANWLMQQPLTDRLTDEEKERIKALYNEYHAHIFHIEMEQILGKELFKQPTEV